MLRKEIKRFLTVVFDGSAAPLVSQLANMDELTLEDLKAVEEQLAKREAQRRKRAPRREAR
jgi:hypothetical protein